MSATSFEDLAATIRELYGIVDRLETAYASMERHFTLDGHLIGSIGEVYAAERYGLELLKSSAKAHDAKARDGRLVQIKVTQRNTIAIGEKPDYLIVLRIDKHGNFEEVYNGPGAQVWELVENRKLPKNGQYQISLSRLRKLAADVPAGERLSEALQVQ